MEHVPTTGRSRLHPCTCPVVGAPERRNLKICEYDNVKCPGCGEEREANENATYGLKD
ncbi:unnamed protein product, partial [marine sediment metagenome]